MNYQEIEAFFINDEGIELLLENCKEMFDRIDNIGEKFRNKAFHNTIELNSVLQELNGILAYLNPIHAIATTEKINQEERFFNQRKTDLEINDIKVIATTLQREASEFVSKYRRVRNILEGYVDVCKVLIGSCQSLLKALVEEHKSA